MTNSNPHDDANNPDDDFDAQLAAEGALAIDKTQVPRREIEVIRPGDEKLDQESRWYNFEVEIGDLYRRGTARPITHTGQQLLGVPVLNRSFFREVDPSAKQGEKIVATWSTKPKSAVYDEKLRVLRYNRHNLYKTTETYWLIDNAIWLLGLFGPDARLAATLNELTDLAFWRDARGEPHPCDLSETKWAISTHVETLPSKFEGGLDGDQVVDLNLDLVGVYREPNGPSRDEVKLARERYHELKRTLPQYPDPNAPGAAPILRAVGSDLTPPDYEPLPGEQPPPVGGPSDYGDSDIPDWMK